MLLKYIILVVLFGIKDKSVKFIHEAKDFVVFFHKKYKTLSF